jgi:hypothetical protein
MHIIMSFVCVIEARLLFEFGLSVRDSLTTVNYFAQKNSSPPHHFFMFQQIKRRDKSLLRRKI